MTSLTQLNFKTFHKIETVSLSFEVIKDTYKHLKKHSKHYSTITFVLPKK